MTNWKPDRVLAVSPHADDVELAAGGTIHKWTQAGAVVHHLVFSTLKNPDVRTVEIQEAAKELGMILPFIRDFENRTFDQHRQEILQILYNMRDLNFDLVLVPCSMDTHQDHQVVHNEAKRAFRDTTILGYEDPWNMYSTDLRLISVLSQENITAKWSAVRAHKSQASRPYVDKSFVGAMAITRAMIVKEKFAEAFEVIRWIM